jgi:tetratricopeptide (TPR) repeat protein
LLEAAQAADPDPWRAALRNQIGRDDEETMRRLAADQATLKTQTARSLVLLGSALRELGDRVRAGRVLQRAWWMDPNDFWVNLELGMVHWTGDNWDRPEEAARYFSSAVAIRPRSGTAYNGLGSVLHAQVYHGEPLLYIGGLPPPEAYVDLDVRDKLDEAIAAFREALWLEPNFPEAHHNLGNALREQGKREEAIAEFRAAIRLKPDYFNAHNNLGGLLCDYSHDYQGAVAEFREALHLKPDDPRVNYNLGNALFHQG